MYDNEKIVLEISKRENSYRNMLVRLCASSIMFSAVVEKLGPQLKSTERI